MLLPALFLASCGLPGMETVEESPPPKRPPVKEAQPAPPSPPPLAPLATPQQVVKAVDVGRRDPFSNVLVPRQSPPPDVKQRLAAKAVRPPSPPPRPLEAPTGLVFQGVLQGSRQIEALVQYTPTNPQEGGVRSGSLRVGDQGSTQPDSLLPQGWGVHAIDGTRGWLVLRSGNQLLRLEL